MKKMTIILIVSLFAIKNTRAQREMRDNTFGGIGAGFLAPVGKFNDSLNSGFQINAEINGRIYRPLWFYVDGSFEYLPVTNTVLTTKTPISTIGGGVGLKIFLLKFLYVKGGAGVRGVVSGRVPNSDNSTVYYNCGAGIYLLKFLNVFADYTSWQAQTGFPANNYFVAGIKLSFGRK